jgi:hypothetical protein
MRFAAIAMQEDGAHTNNRRHINSAKGRTG